MKRNITINQTPMTAELHYLQNELRIQFRTDTEALAALAKDFFQKALTKISVCIEFEESRLDLAPAGAAFHNEEANTGSEKKNLQTFACILSFDVPFDAVIDMFEGLADQQAASV